MALGGIPGVPNSAFPSRLVREDSGSGQLLSGFHPGGTASQPSSGDPLMPMSHQLPGGGHGGGSAGGGLATHGSGVALMHTGATGPANGASHLQTGLSTDDVQSLMAQVRPVTPMSFKSHVHPCCCGLKGRPPLEHPVT